MACCRFSTSTTIARYVADGGALLMATGPDPLNADSVYEQPARPSPAGHSRRQYHRDAIPGPAITALGARHPVTANLPGGNVDPAAMVALDSVSSRPMRTVVTR